MTEKKKATKKKTSSTALEDHAAAEYWAKAADRSAEYAGTKYNKGEWAKEFAKKAHKSRSDMFEKERKKEPVKKTDDPSFGMAAGGATTRSKRNRRHTK